MILVVPVLIFSAISGFATSEKVNTRFETEVNFVESDFDSDMAGSMGTGRFARWERLVNMFSEFDVSTKLIGTAFAHNAHNQYLAYLLQIGIIGVAFFILILVRFYLRLSKIFNRTKNAQIFAAMTTLMMFCVLALFGHPFYYTTILWYLMIMLALINVFSREKGNILILKTNTK